jgi:hypothetical protein
MLSNGRNKRRATYSLTLRSIKLSSTSNNEQEQQAGEIINHSRSNKEATAVVLGVFCELPSVKIVRVTYSTQNIKHRTTTTMEQNAFPTTDTLFQSPMRRLRNLRVRRSNNGSKIKKSKSALSLSTLTDASDFASKIKNSKSALSLSTLTDFSDVASSHYISECSAEPVVLGCLKVCTHDESLRRSYHSHSDAQESRSVNFSTIEVRSYPMIMGDAPSVSLGPPLTIDWEHQDVEEYDVSDYEKAKPKKRSKAEMLVPAEVREAWLRDQGYAWSEMEEVRKEINCIKKRRSATISQQRWQPLFSLSRQLGRKQ